MWPFQSETNVYRISSRFSPELVQSRVSELIESPRLRSGLRKPEIPFEGVTKAFGYNFRRIKRFNSYTTPDYRLTISPENKGTKLELTAFSSFPMWLWLHFLFFGILVLVGAQKPDNQFSALEILFLFTAVVAVGLHFHILQNHYDQEFVRRTILEKLLDEPVEPSV